MAKGVYIGVSGATRKVKTPYFSVAGIAREVKAGYIGVNGVARAFYKRTYKWQKYNAEAYYAYKVNDYGGETGNVRYCNMNEDYYWGKNYSFSPSTGLFTLTDGGSGGIFNLQESGVLIGNYICDWDADEDPEDGHYAYGTFRCKFDELRRVKSITTHGSGTYKGWYYVTLYYDQYIYSGGPSYKQGSTYYGEVTSESPTAYPENGQKGDYWYVRV